MSRSWRAASRRPVLRSGQGRLTRERHGLQERSGLRRLPPPRADRRRRRRRRQDLAVGEDVAPVGATVVDVAGGLLLPGFTDAHVHPVQGGLERLGCDLSGLAADSGAYLRAHPRVRRRPPRPRLDPGRGMGDGGLPRWPADRWELDEVVADRPVALANRDHHGMWVNSRPSAPPASPRPPLTRRTGASSAMPTGDRRASSTRERWTSSPMSSRPRTTTRCTPVSSRASATCTRWASPAGRTPSSAPTPACGTPDRRTPGPRPRGDLTGTVVGALWWDRDRGSEQVPELLARREAYTHGRFSATAVKIMQDGVAENGTAALVEPYLDRCGHATANSGISFVDPDDLRGYVRELDGHGFQVHFHGLGDRGVREALDALEGTDPRPPAPDRPPPARAPRRRRPVRGSSASPPTSRRSGPATTTR